MRGCDHDYTHLLEDCPVCGLEHGATMGSSSWLHDYSCCSDRCGFALKELIETNQTSPQYETLLRQLRLAIGKVENIQEQVNKFELRGIKALREKLKEKVNEPHRS